MVNVEEEAWSYVDKSLGLMGGGKGYAGIRRERGHMLIRVWG